MSTSVLDGTVKQVLRRIVEITDEAQLDALLAEEERSGRGPKGTGRKGVLDGIQEQLGTLRRPGVSPGLARGPERPDDIAVPAPAPPAPAPQPAPWIKKEWAGLPLFVCRTCGKDFLDDVGAAYEHVKKRHPGQLP